MLFKNLIFYITASIQIDIYNEQKENFKKVFTEIIEILATYVNKENLASINEEKSDIIYNYIYDNIVDYCVVQIEQGTYNKAYSR